MFNTEVLDILISGGVGVIPTDTLYGIVGRADLPSTVERIYKTRERNEKKPCIVLIASIEDLNKFGIWVSSEIKEYLESKKLWPGKISIIFSVSDGKFSYLTRGSGSLAFRVPDNKDLRELIKETGPLIAPSANIEGEPTATNISDAKVYFGDKVDFYVDEGEINSEPSTLIKFEKNCPIILREGAVKII